MAAWSEKFLPTEGLSTTVLMPSWDNSVLLPMPEFKRICGVAMLPAERIISFAALMCFVGPRSHG